MTKLNEEGWQPPERERSRDVEFEKEAPLTMVRGGRSERTELLPDPDGEVSAEPGPWGRWGSRGRDGWVW